MVTKLMKKFIPKTTTGKVIAGVGVLAAVASVVLVTREVREISKALNFSRRFRDNEGADLANAL